MEALASIGEAFAQIAAGGSLVLAVPVALLAGLVSFLSPCVLPLVPGYLSYVTGLSGTDLARRWGESPERATVAGVRVFRVRGRLVAGASLFVLGFTAVFVATGAVFGGLGSLLFTHAVTVQRVLGVLVIVLGLGFVGVVPWLQRDKRIHRLPSGGLAGGPVLGALFGLGWTPCIGPTLAAVLSLAASEASATRGAMLAMSYSLGLGVPLVLSALGLRRVLACFDVARRHARAIIRAGGALMVFVGLLLVTGLWNAITVQLRVWISGVTLPI